MACHQCGISAEALYQEQYPFKDSEWLGSEQIEVICHCYLLYFSLLNFPMPSNCKGLLYPSNHHACQSRLARSQMRRRTPVCSRACVLHVLMPGWLASERREQRNKPSKMLSRRNNLWINVELHLLQTLVNITDYISTLSKLQSLSEVLGRLLLFTSLTAVSCITFSTTSVQDIRLFTSWKCCFTALAKT